MQWIDIKKNLPEAYKNVLCLIDGEPPEVLSWNNGYWSDTDDEEYGGDVTHWMPLPPPPSSYNSDYAKCKNHDHDLKGSWEYRQCNRCGEYVAVG